MHILLIIIIVLIVLGLALYAISLLSMIDQPIKNLIMIASILVAVIFILARSGLVPMMISHPWMDKFWLAQMHDLRSVL